MTSFRVNLQGVLVIHKVCLSLVFSLPFLSPTQSSATRAVSARPSTAEQQHRGQQPSAPGPPGPTGRPQPIDPGIGTGTNLTDHGSNKFADILFQMKTLDFLGGITTTMVIIGTTGIVVGLT